MVSPITAEKSTAPTALARPNFHPSTLAIRTMARTLMAGPE
jgi:hypothetical protein